MQVNSQSESERFAQTISKFQDQIEDTKFAIASLRIESAFRIMIKIFRQKQAKVVVTFVERLKDISTKQIFHCIERPITLIFQTVQKIKERNIMKAFIKLKVYAQSIQRENSSPQRESAVQNFSDSRRRLAMTTNGYQMSNEEMEQECLFLKEQIKKIEKSFQDFYNNLQKH